MIAHGWIERIAMACVSTFFGCVASEPVASTLIVTPATQAADRQLPLTIDEIKAGLDDLPVWPFEQRDFSPREWLQIVEFAERLQQTDAGVVATALKNFVRQHEYKTGPVSPCFEWSKVYILLRVLFDVPSERYDERKHTLPPITGGGFMPSFRSRRECERLESVLSRPILWTKRGPRLFSSLVGYNGKPYNVDVEWSAYREHYRYRNLDDALRILRAKVAAERYWDRKKGHPLAPVLSSAKAPLANLWVSKRGRS